jgi:ABC-type glutathione transport system ATPase component
MTVNHIQAPPASTTGTASPPPALTFSQVSLILRRRGSVPVPLVEDVSLRLERGERLALVGESGSGKSVLARAVLGLDGGRVQVCGEIRVGGRSAAARLPWSSRTRWAPWTR